jgi:hypothetical protein
MINDNPSYQSSTENGNPIHPPSSDNLTHQQPSSDNLAQFIRMLGNLSPADRQTLASALSYSPSPETDADPYLSTKPTVKTLEPYDRLEEWLPSFKQRDEFFNLTKSREQEEYTDVKQFHRVQHLDYAAPPLTSSRDVNVHKNVYKRDQDMATIQARLAHLTRPIDATVHAILASNPMDIEDPVLINIIETFDILRFNLASIATEITHLRKEALYRDKKLIPPTDPNDKTPLITHQQFIDQEKFTHSLRKASGQVGRGRGRGRGRGGFSNLGNRNGQQNNNNHFDNPIENSGNYDKNGSQNSNSDTSTNSNNNNNSGNNGNHFQQSSTTRGRGRGRGSRQ